MLERAQHLGHERWAHSTRKVKIFSTQSKCVSRLHHVCTGTVGPARARASPQTRRESPKWEQRFVHTWKMALVGMDYGHIAPVYQDARRTGDGLVTPVVPDRPARVQVEQLRKLQQVEHAGGLNGYSGGSSMRPW